MSRKRKVVVAVIGTAGALLIVPLPWLILMVLALPVVAVCIFLSEVRDGTF